MRGEWTSGTSTRSPRESNIENLEFKYFKTGVEWHGAGWSKSIWRWFIRVLSSRLAWTNDARQIKMAHLNAFSVVAEFLCRSLNDEGAWGCRVWDNNSCAEWHERWKRTKGLRKSCTSGFRVYWNNRPVFIMIIFKWRNSVAHKKQIYILKNQSDVAIVLLYHFVIL